MENIVIHQKNILKVLISLSFALSISHGALADELLADQDLFSEPKAQSNVSAKAKKGQVSVVEKQGFWVKIKAGDALGWTKLSNIKAASTGGIGLPETGRGANGNIVSTSGVRGLDGGDLINAKPDIAELGKLVSLKITKEQGETFASSAGLESRKVSYTSQSVK
jgi:hypothetical protein